MTYDEPPIGFFAIGIYSSMLLGNLPVVIDFSDTKPIISFCLSAKLLFCISISLWIFYAGVNVLGSASINEIGAFEA